ncbi:hypothetical protein FZ934_24530 (plasmid) [Rhizobium grahamii]|uniref:Uncharacterized protein n=1 Tax=Rhizobium grahamii TaxID=1120045 RepID=A0A5Q0CDN2_9HYPH|nr:MULTISPECIES: hypothetical protein [Rhizobium]QFY63425.1 hypothetical protein FZ934_24530 [Rhizobium grahamii]QRM51810.1 hypothetical protein F3Y33_21115 [Rhizobium sp. BG6]
MQQGLATITISDEGLSEHVAFEIKDRTGLLFARQELLLRAKNAKNVRLSLLTARCEHLIRIGNIDFSCANFSIIRDL